MKKKIAIVLGTILIGAAGVGMAFFPQKGQQAAEPVMEEVSELPIEEEIVEEVVEMKPCEEGCTLEPGHEGECVLEEVKEEIEVILKSTSVERDLKVKYVDKKTGKLISGADFKIKLINSSKKSKEYSDHDNDGIIWVKNIDDGSYTVEMLELEGYVTAKNLTAEVKKKIEYKVVEVAEEIKKESQIVVSKEDGAYGGTSKDESTSGSAKLEDTVESVESTKKENETAEKTQKLDAFGQPMYEKQALDKFGQKMYKEQKVDAFGTKMYKVILSEPASYHEDSDKNGICDRCSAPYSGSETAPGTPEPETPVDPGTPEPETPVDPGTQEPETPVDPETPAPETPVDPGTQEPETPAPETPEQPEMTEETQPQSEETEAVDPASVEESPTTAKVVLRPFYFLSAAAVVEKIVYDETSAPIYDETSAPIYDTTSAPVYETVSAPTYTGWQTIDGKTYYFDKNGNKVTGYQVINGVAYTFNSEGVRQGNIGIDVSKYQTGINWKKVKNAGIDFVMIRCGYRGYGSGVLVEDPMFASHISGAKAAGLRVGVYFFSQAVNEAEAVEEASMAVTLARKYGINMPIAIDSEYAANGAGRADKLSKSQRTAVTKAFCNTVRNAGYTPMVYASKSWFETHLNASQLSGYKIWVAHYAEKCGYSGRYDIWQNTDKGKVDGIPGYVDMNIGTL